MAQATGRYNEEGWRVCKDGRRFWANVAITAMRNPDGSLEGYGKITRDLTEHKQGEQQATNTMALLRTSVLTDPLTGVLNRRALDQALVAAIKVGRPFCVAMLDLDHFKEVNDRLGHAVGDNFLRQATLAWRNALRHDDLLARYGGEEFTLVLPGCDLAAGIATTERIRARTPSECTCSAGVAAWSSGMTGDDLLSTADRALYEAKAQGRNCVWPKAGGVPPANDV
jgi:diguanylate cyclase (GGDEF)-like protein